ncbi:MAG TPA: hypothetical protein VLE72_01465 [Candidatus Saccharimonadales bacterium]|nr:hypothetical protein [Candidatus Saccharimonadales bacterium]
MPTDPVTELARSITRTGTSRAPLYDAARQICAQEETARREYLAARDPNSTEPLDSTLFPPDVFEADGSRRRWDDDRPRNTPAEERMFFEWGDRGF